MEGDSTNPVYINNAEVLAPFENSADPEILQPDDSEFLSFQIRDSVNEDLLNVLDMYGINAIQEDPNTLLKKHFERYL